MAAADTVLRQNLNNDEEVSILPGVSLSNK